MNPSRSDYGTIGKRGGGGWMGATCASSDFLVWRFRAFLISPWLNTPLTDTLIRLGLCALWAY